MFEAFKLISLFEQVKALQSEINGLFSAPKKVAAEEPKKEATRVVLKETEEEEAEEEESDHVHEEEEVCYLFMSHFVM